MGGVTPAEPAEITQEAAAELLGVSDWTFRRLCGQYREQGEDGLADPRLGGAPQGSVPGAEVDQAHLPYGQTGGFTAEPLAERIPQGVRAAAFIESRYDTPWMPGSCFMPHVMEGQLDDRRVIDLLRVHLKTCRAETPPGSAHALDLAALKSPEITFLSMWDGETLLAVGALKRLSADHGEIKSMHVARPARRMGAGSAMLHHLMAAGRAGGITRLSLETGSSPYFLPARTLYQRHGFIECPPFANYVPDPNSVFMTRDLPAGGAATRE